MDEKQNRKEQKQQNQHQTKTAENSVYHALLSPFEQADAAILKHPDLVLHILLKLFFLHGIFPYLTHLQPRGCKNVPVCVMMYRNKPARRCVPDRQLCTYYNPFLPFFPPKVAG